MALALGLSLKLSALAQQCGWPLGGASVDLNFAQGRYYGGSLASISTTRASTGYAQTSSGLLVPFASNVPRITDQGLLVEEARTNLALNSAGFTGWAGSAGGTASAASATANYSTAPDGTATATRVQFALNGGTTTADFVDWRIANTTVSAATAYVNTLYIKSNTGSSYNLLIMDVNSVQIAITVTPTWQRFTAAGTSGGTTGGLRIRLRGGQTPTNSDSVDLSIWGAQQELGTFATSPILTTSSTATRAADVITLTGAAATAALAAKAAYFETNGLNLVSGGNYLLRYGGTATLFNANATSSWLYNATGNAIGTFGSGTTATLSKNAFGFDATSCTAKGNGGATGTLAGAWAGNTGAVTLGSVAGGNSLNGYMRRVAFSATKGAFDGLTT